jgi:HD-GYP domain-containing protein (c-di-GMP phosphodiesterase class II)
MKKRNVSEITHGMIADSDWFSEKGELLISRGTTISERHLEVLRRRHIFEIFVEGKDADDDELQNLLSVKFERMEEIDFDFEPLPPPAGIENLGTIPKGEKGLRQLNESSLTLELDKMLRSRHTADKPIGPALREKATELIAPERSEKYKLDVAGAYQWALRQVHSILHSLVSGNRLEGGELVTIVKRFVDIFVSDRNILLNISATKPRGDNFLYHHSLNVCLLSVNIAAAYGYSEKQVIEIGVGALLHDLGMLLLPREIYLKKSRLTQEEWYEIQKHPVLGLHLLEKIRRLPESVSCVAYQTHERENRTGYPKQRGGNLIHRFAKIVQVADIYESLSSPRPYRKQFLPYESMERLIKMTRSGLISGEYVKAFLKYASLFPVGSLVELSDKQVAKVTRANGESYAKPVVCVIADPDGRILPKTAMVELNLADRIDLYIVKALSTEYIRDVSLMDGF